ncbi:MAG TPA: hypothetical protein PLF21_04455 [Exilispira sp.]|mgnify:CR=1 FL=1|nr:hypothetical protein [Exilispira sp.]
MKMIFLYIFGNSIFWTFVFFSSAYIVHFLLEKFYNYKNFLFKAVKIEKEGKLYKNIFFIDRWKDKIPEAGKFLGLHPFSKRHFVSKKKEYVERFILETCRGELSHLLPFIFYPISLIWNPMIANIIMFLFVLIFNLPFILVQRYNRIRLTKLLHKIENQ